MRLTRSGAALQWGRARAPDDLRYRGSDRPGSEPNSAGAEVGTWNVRWKTRSPGPPLASAPGAFISPVSVHEPPGRATTTTEKPRLKLPGTRRTAGWAPRPPGPEPELEPWPSLGRGRRFPLSLDSEWVTGRPVARLPGWLLHRGGTSTWAACALPPAQQQHISSEPGTSAEEQARWFSRADLTLSLTTILGNLTDDRRKIERAPPGTTIPCGEGLIIAVYTLG
jgi:hypothetical protein